MNYLQFSFDLESQPEQERMVALLSEQGFEGFEENGHILDAFIAEQNFDEKGFSTVIESFSKVSYTTTVIENINWNQQWEESFEPVVVEDFVAVRAAFHAPIRNVRYEIIITPKMSFGTGHHATTHLMMNEMQHIDFAGKSVLDFGTGTGILAILATKLGASDVLAIDCDEWSIANSKENVEQNSCDNITIVQKDNIPVSKKVDIILANINLNVLVANMDSIAEVLKPKGDILLSGFLKENEPAIVAALQNAGLKFFSNAQRGEWLIVIAKNG
ncbi:MAG: 50S ribosomal protein L11 methyltransferase [Ferruginibacter sp.]